MEDEILQQAAKITRPDPDSLHRSRTTRLSWATTSSSSRCGPGTQPGRAAASWPTAPTAPRQPSRRALPLPLGRLPRAVSCSHRADAATHLGCGALHPSGGRRSRLARRGPGPHFDGDADRRMLAGATTYLHGEPFCSWPHATSNPATAHRRPGRRPTDVQHGPRAAPQTLRIRMLRAHVGDRYVSNRCSRHHAALGGEQSGHILLPHLATTGDGLLTALRGPRPHRAHRPEPSTVDRRFESLSAKSS